jgi:hypothetical protein
VCLCASASGLCVFVCVCLCVCVGLCVCVCGFWVGVWRLLCALTAHKPAHGHGHYHAHGGPDFFFRYRGHTRAIVKCPLYAHKTHTKVTLHVAQSAVALKIQPKCPHVVEVPAWVISRVIATQAGT